MNCNICGETISSNINYCLTCENDEHAISNFNKLDLKEFSWKDDGMRKSRITYEVVKDVKVKDTTHRTVDRFREES